jgi:SAM-dependent methyltransferase
MISKPPFCEGVADYYSTKNRDRKWSLFVETFPVSPEARVLDVGFTEIEYSPVDNYLERQYLYPGQITALGVDRPHEFLKRYPAVRPVCFDGGIFPFADRAFTIVWSNAVLEHVGNREAQVLFLKEVKRVGEKAFITTPNRWFPVEVHTRTPLLHWLPKKWFDRYLKWVKKMWAVGDRLQLVSEGELKRLLAEAGIIEYQIIKNRLFGFVVDFVVVWG